MRKEKIMQILVDWNFWEKEPDTGIERERYIQKMHKLVNTGQILTISGVRRSGKSTLMLQYAKYLINKGLSKNNILYVNFEDPRFVGELSLNLLQEIYEAYLEYLQPKGKTYLFLDEIQNINAWEKFVRSLHERKEAFIIVSGSSSKLLSKEFGTVLTGRHVTLEIFPLDFKEFLLFNNLQIKTKLDLFHHRIKIKSLLRKYIEEGAFPKVVLSMEKKEILRRYFEDIISRDIIERYKIKNIEKLKELAKFYLTNTASISSFNKIKNFLKLPIDTVERYSYYLSSTYLIFLVKKFSYSLKEQELNPRKAYSIDTGLRNIISFRFSQDVGKLYENLVFLELAKQGKEIYYWKNGKYDLDFVVKGAKKPEQLIQVCFNLEDSDVMKREIKSLLIAMDKFKLRQGIIITEDKEGEERHSNKKIIYIPLWKWLLGLF